MKNLDKSSEAEALLNAVLADESWQALNSSLRRQAVGALCATNRKRRFRHWVGQAACTAALFAAVVWWLGVFPQPVISPERLRQNKAATATQKTETPFASATTAHFISEQEMLALFPAGSCVVAEINGQKEFVVLDLQIAEEGFTVAEAPSQR